MARGGAIDQGESWLVPDHTDRARMLDMDRRLQPIRRAAFAVLALILLATGQWIGYWTLLPLLVAGVLFTLADRRIERAAKPEYWIFAAWSGSQVMIAVSVILAGAVGFPSLAWFAIPVVTLSARFSLRGIAIGVVITIALMIGVTVSTHAHEVADSPPLFLMPLGVVLAVAILSTALMRSDLEHRSKSVVDPLTGMLNRAALQNRVEELRQQSEVIGAPIGLIVIDIDHFKLINDTVGHAAGDRVLQDVAYLIRKGLRAFDLAYRLGGEEFVVLLPGAGGEEALGLAERLRHAIEDAVLPHGTSVTVSCGVGSSPAGSPLDYETLFEATDAALYEAKSRGRNQVLATEGVAALAG